jgi:putative endonuclease
VDHKYWVYIVASRSGTLYIGMTNNIDRRMREHKSGSSTVLPANIIAIGWCISRPLMMFTKQ